MGYGSLKDLIRAIRSTKTAAEEREVIQKESAYLRTAFKEEHVDTRLNNVSKLLYIHMLGYPAHFGQIECLKLVAGTKYGDKRIGYLGISLLIDENQETLTLVTNSLKNDMNHPNMYIVGLALGTLGNIASVEVAQDLTDEVEKLMESNNSYIRKKAALCGIRIIHKVPDLYEQYMDKALNLINDKNHGVMLTGVTLIEEMCQLNPDLIQHFKKAVPILVRRLKALATTSSFLPELDVNGVTDPFLQVKILKLLTTLGEGDVSMSEDMNDVLAQVATNTDGSKNAGNSILYEVVLTIMAIESDQDLRLLAINILGKFLANKDNNTRYVALTALNKAVSMDLPAVQRHHNTILDCLQDQDISIKRGALDLAFALIDSNNIRILVRELLVFLESADGEFKQDTAVQIYVAAERYAPNRRWHIDTVIRVLKLAGNFVNEDIVSGLTRLICQSPDLHGYSTKKLYSALTEDSNQESLILAGIWSIGEFSNALIQPIDQSNDEEPLPQPTPTEILSLLEKILKSPLAFQTISIQQYLTTSLMKLTSRFSNQPNSSILISKIKQLLLPLTKSNDVEVQQRSLEYLSIIEYGNGDAVFEQMPISNNNDQSKLLVKSQRKKQNSKRRSQIDKKSNVVESNLLLDLMGDINNEPSSIINSTTPSNSDLLSELMSNTSLTSSKPSSSNVMDLLNDITPTTSSPSIDQSLGYLAYSNYNLFIQLQPEKDATNPNVTNIVATFTNSSNHQINDLSFQVAVPKSQRVQLLPPTSTQLNQNDMANQTFRIANPTKVAIRLRLKVSFNLFDQQVSEMVEFNGFPDSIV